MTCTPRSPAIRESRSMSRALSSKALQQRRAWWPGPKIRMIEHVGGAAQVERALAEAAPTICSSSERAPRPERIQRIGGPSHVVEDLAERLAAVASGQRAADLAQLSSVPRRGAEIGAGGDPARCPSRSPRGRGRPRGRPARSGRGRCAGAAGRGACPSCACRCESRRGVSAMSRSAASTCGAAGVSLARRPARAIHGICSRWST